VSDFSAQDQEEDASLLAPDDSLASHASLVSMAVYPSGQPVPHNVTTLLVSNRAALDESVAASLPAATDHDSTTYRVKKLRPSSEDTVKIKTRVVAFWTGLPLHWCSGKREDVETEWSEETGATVSTFSG